MAHEAVLVYQTGFPVNFIVSDTTGIEKGAHLALTDPMTAALSTTEAQAVAGVAQREKIANNGQTELAVFRSGIFRVYVSGSVTAGDRLGTSATTGYLMLANQLVSGSKTWGVALETGTTGEQILAELNPR